MGHEAFLGGRMLGFCWIALLIPASALVQGLEAKDPKSAVLKGAKEAGQATLKGDFGKLADCTFPKILELMGGREKMISTIEKAMKQMKEKGFTFRSYEVGEPGEFFSDGPNTFVVIPTKVEMNVPDGKLSVKGYLLAISADKGTTWKYVDGAGMRKKEILGILPKLPAKLKLPEPRQPEFTKDK